MKIYYKENGRFVKATGDGIFKESANVNEIQFKLPGVPNNSVVFATFLLPYPQESDQYGNYSAQSLKLENKVDTEDGGYLWSSPIPGGYLVNNGTAYINASIHLADGTTTYTENEQTGDTRTITVGTTTYVITYNGNNLVLTAGSIEFTTNTTTSIIINNKIYLIKGTSTQLQLVAQLKVKTTERVQFIIENSGDYEATAVTPELGEQILYELANQHSDIIDIQAELELKQDKTDNNLETTSKTVVGAINELKSETDSLDTQINSTDPEHPGINARLTTAEQNIVDINIEQGVQNTNIQANTDAINGTQDNPGLLERVSELEQTAVTGENYVGTLSGSVLPTDAQLNQYVNTHEGRNPTGGDYIYFILQVSGGTDRNYKYTYSNTTGWGSSEIPAVEVAGNDTFGIVKGSYENGTATAVQVQIVGGEFIDIWIVDNETTKRRLAEYLNTNDARIADLETDVAQAKQDITENSQDIDALETAVGKIEDGTTVVPKADQANKDGLGRNISGTYMTQESGATKTYVKDYALPREFNDVSFVGADNKFVSEVPTGTSPLYTVNVSQIGDNTLFYVEKTIQNAEFQLGNKNSYTDTLYVTASINCTVAFRVTTQVYTNSQWVTLNAELTDPIDLTANVIKKINFGSPLNLLNQVLDIQSGDTIKQTFEVVTETSTATTFNVYSNETYASTFYLNTTAQTIYVAQGYLGEIPVHNLNGTLTSGDLVFEIGQDVVINENVVSLFKLNYTDTITNSTPIYLKQGNEKLRVITPYNYTNSNDATFGDLKQTYIQSGVLLFTGLFLTIGGNRAVVVNIDNLNEVYTEINNLITSAVFKALAPSSTTLTEEELTTIQNNNCVLTTSLNISTITLTAGTILTKPFEYSGTLRGLYINNSKIGTYLITISTRTIGAGAQDIVLNNLAQINGKAIPSYPSNTGTFVFEMVNGTLTWSQKIEYGFQRFAVADWNNLTAQERVALIQHGVIIDGTLSTMKNPILLPPTSSTSAGLWGVAIHGDTYEPQKINIYSISTTYGTISVNTNYGLKARIDVADFGSDATIIKDSQNRVTIKFGNNEKAKFGSLDALFACRVTPDANNTYDLGRSGVYWKDLHLAGNLTDGTNSISIADIASKNFVNSSIATNTANFIGTFADIPTLNAYSGTITNNDYAFVVNSVIKDNGNDFADTTALNAYDKTLLTNFDYAWVINGTKFDLYRFDIVNQTWGLRVANTDKADVTLNTAYNRYKAVVSGSTVTWEFEFTLNNSSFTAQQWQAINSGINPTLVAQISTNAGNILSLQTDKENISNKVTSLDANSTDTQYPSAKCVYDLVGNINTILTRLNNGTGV